MAAPTIRHRSIEIKLIDVEPKTIWRHHIITPTARGHPRTAPMSDGAVPWAGAPSSRR